MALPSIKTALTIAGSDSGGGAGIQADLKTFAALQVHGATVITAITAQSPDAVKAVEPCSVGIVRTQLEAVAQFKVAAAKTGMLFSAEIIAEVASFFAEQPRLPLVVDPVMISTSGASLLKEEARRALVERLLPLATLVTPNTAEAEALLGFTVKEPEDLREAARELHERFGCAALVKGGHLNTGSIAIDVFSDGEEELLLEAPRARKISTHGTGCTFSAAITALLAQGADLPTAVTEAKQFITGAIHGSVRAGRFNVLNPFYPR